MSRSDLEKSFAAKVEIVREAICWHKESRHPVGRYLDIWDSILVLIDSLDMSDEASVRAMARSSVEAIAELLVRLAAPKDQPPVHSLPSLSIPKRATELPGVNIPVSQRDGIHERLDTIIDLLGRIANRDGTVEKRADKGTSLKVGKKRPQGGNGVVRPVFVSEYPIREPYRSRINALPKAIFWGNVGTFKFGSASYIINMGVVPDSASLLEAWMDGTFTALLKKCEKTPDTINTKLVTTFSNRASALFDLFAPHGPEHVRYDVLEEYLCEREEKMKGREPC